MTTRRLVTELANHTMDGQVARNQGKNCFVVGLRAFASVTLTSALLAGCGTPMERPTTAVGLPGGSDYQATADLTRRLVADAPTADPAIGGNDYRVDMFPCLARPADCRIRDLRTPWEERRYLMPDGTLSGPPDLEMPR